MVEVWRDIEDYVGSYQISNFGRVRSLERIENCRGRGKRLNKGRFLKQFNGKDKYKFVSLCKYGKTKQCSVHRLVAQAFIPNPDNLPCINHKDENKSNNSVNNLEWCTIAYNNNYGTAIQRRVEKQSKPVLQYTLNGEFVNEYPSVMETARQTGILQSNISMCCLGKRKTAKGFIWRYKKNGGD